MTSTNKALIAAAIAFVFAIGLIYWQFKARGHQPANLSAEDMALIAEDQPAQVKMRLANDEPSRKELAKQVRQLLAVAEEARAKGVANNPEIKSKVQLMRAFIIAQTYFKTQQANATGAPPAPNVTDAEIDEYFKQPTNQAKFDQFIKDAQAKNPLPPEQIKQYKHQFGEAMVGERKGIEAGVDRKRSTQLQILLQESRDLAITYVEEQLVPKTKATDQEIDAYIAKHPELDSSQNRSKAEGVLKRVRAGEDFAKLAQEFSSDPGSKDKGGDLGWFGPGAMVAEFDKAAFALKAGETSGIVETKYGFHIIRVDERRTETKDGKPEEQVHARHILIGDGQPGKSGRDQARNAVEQEKLKKEIDDIEARSPVKVAENFTVTAPAAQSMPQLPPGMSGPDEDEGGPPPQAAPAPPDKQKPKATPAKPALPVRKPANSE